MNIANQQNENVIYNQAGKASSLHSRLYINHQKASQAGHLHITDIPFKEENEHADKETDTPIISVSEAKRQNALFKQRELERLKSEDNDTSSRLRVVDHGHYEQWARSPVKRSNTSVLYRGIQQLRARVVREDFDKYYDQKMSLPDNYFSRDNIKHSAHSSVSFEQFPKDTYKHSAPTVYQSISSSLRRQRTMDSNVSRFSGSSRSTMKVPNAVVHVLSDRLDTADSYINYDRKAGTSKPREQMKFRFGAVKTRDRFPLSLPVNAPKCFEDHMFLVNEPLRSSEIYKQKSKLDLKELDSKRHKSDYRLQTLDTKDETNSASSQESTNKPKGSAQSGTRSKAYFGSFAPRKLLATIRVAELYDFSQMSQHKQPTELRYIERQMTDPTIMMRGSKVIKWAPHLQRMNEKN